MIKIILGTKLPPSIFFAINPKCTNAHYNLQMFSLIIQVPSFTICQ